MNTVKLGAVVETIMGQAPAGKDCNKNGNGVPFVKVGEFGSVRPSIREWTTDPKRMAQKTDVLLCVVGATCGKINLGEVCAIGRSVAAIRPIEGKILQQYLHYFMLGKVEKLRGMSQGAAQTVISKAMIADVDIPLLPLPEQKQIVALLDEAFAGISQAVANAEKNLANARELFDSYLNNIFTQKGEGWSTKTLIDVCQKIQDGAHRSPQTLYSEPAPNLFPYLTSKNIRDGYLKLDTVQYCDADFHNEIYPNGT